MDERQISQLETLNHRLRARIWRKAQRAGVSRVGLLPTQWVDIDSTFDSVCGRQEGAAKGYNPNKKSAGIDRKRKARNRMSNSSSVLI